MMIIKNNEINNYLKNLCFIKDFVFENRVETGYCLYVPEERLNKTPIGNEVFISTSELGRKSLMIMKCPDNEADCGPIGDRKLEAIEFVLGDEFIGFEEAEKLASEKRANAQSRRRRFKSAESGASAPEITIGE